MSPDLLKHSDRKYLDFFSAHQISDFENLKISDIKNCTHKISIRITEKLGYCVSFVYTKLYRNHRHQIFDILIFEISDF